MKHASTSPILHPEALTEFLRIMEERTGLCLSPRKDQEIAFRIGDEITRAGGADIFVRRIASSDSFRQLILNRLTIGESYFFRNHPHFAALTERILPDLIARRADSRTLRCWSAGCATGEEPYSLAILFDREFPSLRDWNVQIVASDINTDYLDKAKAARWGSWSFRGVEKDIMERYFSNAGRNEYTLREDIRNRVSFRHFNLSTIPADIPAEFRDMDLILCRNVLIYFTHALSAQICRGFAMALRDGGYLMLGHSESFPQHEKMETIYSHATYYYHRDDRMAERTASAHLLSLIPGIGEFPTLRPLTKFPSVPPPRRGRTSAGPAAPARSAISPPPPPPSWKTDLDDELALVRDLIIDSDIERAQALLVPLRQQKGRLDYRVFFLAALLEDQRNDTEEALRFLKQAIFLNKDFVIGHYYQAVICERTGDTLTARRAYQNTCALANRLLPSLELPEGGGITSGRLAEIAAERLKELEL